MSVNTMGLFFASAKFWNMPLNSSRWPYLFPWLIEPFWTASSAGTALMVCWTEAGWWQDYVN